MDLGMLAWLLLVLAALCVGFAKTAVAGAGLAAVALFAVALPARESTGALLPLLIAGDVLAVSLYRRHASVGVLLRMLPGVFPGILLGAWFVAEVDDTVMRPAIAVVILAMVGIQLVQRRRRGRDGAPVVPTHPHVLVTLVVGALAGFATMTANAAGPVITLYLLMAGLPLLELLGTGAWFYLVVNLVKLPFSAGLALVSGTSLLRDLVLLPAMLLGAYVGTRVVARIDRDQFERVALLLSAVSAVALLA